jgi:chemotaxis protein CheD
MTENLQTVPIGEMVTSANPDDVLVVYGLGSCVVICFYDPFAKVGGMLHALLPGPTWGQNHRKANPTKFVNQGVPLLIDSLVSLGAEPTRLEVQLCGGAKVAAKPAFNNTPLNIGERNVQAARLALQAAGLKLKAEATGGKTGRTVKLHIASGQVTVKTLGQQETVLV